MSTENPVKTYRVVLVDDHAIFRSGLRADLAHDIEIAGEAGTVEEAIKVIHEQQPDVVLLDVHLPGGRGGGGAEVLKDCTGLLGSTRFLALSVSDAAQDVVTVIRSGARGYVTKSISGAEISDAVRRVAGETRCSPRVWPGSCSMPLAAALRWRKLMKNLICSRTGNCR